MCIWTRKSIHHYKWLVQLGLELCKEYTHRYDNTHCGQVILEWLSEHIPEESMFSSHVAKYKKGQRFAYFSIPENCSRVPICMPETYMHNNLLSAYRHYYIGDKVDFAKWKRRKIPQWFEDKNYDQDLFI